jgi:hypothetical protein
MEQMKASWKMQKYYAVAKLSNGDAEIEKFKR